MKPSEALAIKREAFRQLLSRYHVLHPRVFGSVLTGQDTEASDLDVLIDPANGMSLLTLAHLENEAEDLLGVPVSILTSEDLPVRFRATVLAQAQPL